MTLMHELKVDIKEAIQSYENSWHAKWFGVSDHRKMDIKTLHKKIKAHYPHGVALKNAIESIFADDGFKTGLLKRSRLRKAVQQALNENKYADKQFWKLYAVDMKQSMQANAIELKRLKHKDTGQCKLIVELQSSVDELEHKLAKARVDIKKAREEKHRRPSMPVRKPQAPAGKVPLTASQNRVAVTHTEQKQSWSLLSIFSSKSKTSASMGQSMHPNDIFFNPRRSSFELSLANESGSDEDVNDTTPLLHQHHSGD